MSNGSCAFMSARTSGTSPAASTNSFTRFIILQPTSANVMIDEATPSAVPAASSSAIVVGFRPNSAEIGQIISDAQAIGKTPSEEGYSLTLSLIAKVSDFIFSRTPDVGTDLVRFQ